MGTGCSVVDIIRHYDYYYRFASCSGITISVDARYFSFSFVCLFFSLCFAKSHWIMEGSIFIQFRLNWIREDSIPFIYYKELEMLLCYTMQRICNIVYRNRYKLWLFIIWYCVDENVVKIVKIESGPRMKKATATSKYSENVFA